MGPFVLCEVQWPLARGAQSWHALASLNVAQGTNNSWFCPAFGQVAPSKCCKPASCQLATLKQQNEREHIRRLPAFAGPQPLNRSQRRHGQRSCACSSSETSEHLGSNSETTPSQKESSTGATSNQKTVRMTKQMAIASGSSGGLLQKTGQTKEIPPALAQVLEFPLPTFEDVSLAMYRTRNRIRNTECTLSDALSELTGCELYLKKEYKQRTGSFKERGARNALLLLSAEQRERGVVAASAGNHALGLAWHGRDIGIPVTVVMPASAPLTKVTKCKALGARVIQHGDDIGEAKAYADEVYVKGEGLRYVNGFDHPHIIAGQGTIGLEMLEQVPDMDAVIVPVGGAGLIAGIALAIKTLQPNVLVIGAEPKLCASFCAALAAGHPVRVEMQSPTLADGLAVPCVGPHSFAVARTLVDGMVQVSERDIGLSVLRLVEHEKLVQEGAGAAGLAALLSGQLPELRGKKVVIPLCGGNIDTTVLGRVIERGLAADGRLVRFSVIVSDRPGGIAALCKIVAEEGASIKDIVHERAWLVDAVAHVQVFMVVETTGREHVERLRDRLEQDMNFKGPITSWGQVSL